MNVLTLGIYSLVYKKQHNPQKVAHKIMNEVRIACKNYKFEKERVDIEKLINENGMDSPVVSEAIVKIAKIEVDIQKEKEKLENVITNIVNLTNPILKKDQNYLNSIRLELSYVQNSLNDKIDKALPEIKKTEKPMPPMGF